MQKMKTQYKKKMQKAHIIHGLQRDIHKTEEELDDVQEKYKAATQTSLKNPEISTLAGDTTQKMAGSTHWRSVKSTTTS